MSRIIAIILVIILSSQCPALKIKRNEIWSGEITLKEDVIVPPDLILTIAPGTKVITGGNKIVSYGTIDILGEKNRQVNFQYLPTPISSIEVIKVKPYDINTKILKEEFKTFKIQYAILWSLLFASTFLMLEAR